MRNWTPHPQHLVEDRPLPADGEIITATGNRFELIASAPLNGKVEVLVDGKAPYRIDGCWQTSRTNYLANVPYWPAISQVTVAPDVHRAMRWTAILTDFSADQTKFTFLSTIR